MTIDLRAQNNRLMEGLVKKVRKSASEAVKPLGAKIELEDAESITAAEYDEGLIEIARRAVTKVLGSSLEPVFTAGSEDFHLYTKKLSIRTTYIGLGADLTPGLHNPEMSFELSALSHGREILKEFVALRLG